MTQNREELIQALAKEISWAKVHGEWTDAAEAALAVFEQAYAPTDDEREALAIALRAGERESRKVGGSATALFSAQADAILAAGFRRTVQAERAKEGAKR